MNKLFIGLFLIVVSLSSISQAADFKKDIKKKSQSLDLISESTQRQLMMEAGIQKDRKTSSMSFGLAVGQLQPSYLLIDVKGNQKAYEFDQALTSVAAQFSAFPIEYKGRWGGEISLAYASSQETLDSTTRIHLIPIELSLGYKYEPSLEQRFSPLLLLGYGSMLYFQRGADQFNTSETSGYVFSTLGLNCNLNALGFVTNSRNQMDLTLKAQQILTAESAQRDFRGTNYSLGVSINL